jgi:hypothetical protein
VSNVKWGVVAKREAGACANVQMCVHNFCREGDFILSTSSETLETFVSVNFKLYSRS